MPQFDAESIAEPLQCRLRPYADFDGVIPEPSDKRIGKFLHAMRDVFTRAQEAVGLDEEITRGDADAIGAAFDRLDPDEFVKVMEEMADLHADLCSGKPSKTQILAVPLRRRLLFFGWLEREVINPEAAPGAGSRPAAALPPPAAGSFSTSPGAISG